MHHSLAELDTTLRDLRKVCKEPPIIVVDNQGQTSRSLELMEFGATHVVGEGSTQLLGRVISREIEHVCLHHRIHSTRKELRETQERCELLMAAASVPIGYVHEGMHIYANDPYAHLFGYAEGDDMLGVPLLDLFAAECTEDIKGRLVTFRENPEPMRFTSSGARENDQNFAAEFTLSATRYDGEDSIQVLVKPTEQAPAPQQPQPASDGNGATIDQFLQHLGKACDQNQDRQHVLLIAQLDDFHTTQREMGIRGANELARMIGVELESAVGRERYSQIDNHRYAMHVSADSEDENRKTIESLQTRIKSMVCEVNDRSARTTVSVVAVPIECFPSVEVALDEGFRQAIEKHERNSTHWHEPQPNDENPESTTATVLRHINRAIEKHSFALLYQPIISLRGDEDEHYEVFLRMINEAGDQIAPNQFLRTAIDNGVAGKIDRWVVLQAIKTLSAHRAKGKDTRITINLTSNSVSDPDFSQWLSVAIKAARLPSDAVIFQVTEEDASSCISATRDFVETLRKMHVRSSLSRYGLAHEPEGLLDHIPVDLVKLDGSHVQKLEEEDKSGEALNKMISTLQARGKLTIVPMVENAQILSHLWQAGVNYIQGHYLQEPAEAMNYDFTTSD
ncbi:MAG: EAL domain-containing protein [Pseudomonadota bacterium]